MIFSEKIESGIVFERLSRVDLKERWLPVYLSFSICISPINHDKNKCWIDESPDGRGIFLHQVTNEHQHSPFLKFTISFVRHIRAFFWSDATFASSSSLSNVRSLSYKSILCFAHNARFHEKAQYSPRKIRYQETMGYGSSTTGQQNWIRVWQTDTTDNILCKK